MTETRTRNLEMIIGTIATGLLMIALAIYMVLEPRRLTNTQSRILAIRLDDAMNIYAENCTVCHGLKGKGLGANPPLNSPGLQAMDSAELFKVIARGRFNTAMPPWSQEDGGPLSDYQIDELVSLIQDGDWDVTGERVVNLGLAPLVPFTTEPDSTLLEQVGKLSEGSTLQTAVEVFAAQCVSCHGADGLGTNIAPALNDPTVRAKTPDELSRTITFGSAGTLMSGWSNVLNADEISAMVMLLQRWDEIPIGTIPMPDVPIPTTAESIALGGELYTANCSNCHGPEGQGTRRAPSLNVKSFLTNTSDLAMQQIISNGIPGTAMPAWGARMGEADIHAIVGFIRQWEATAPEVASPLRGGGGPPWLRNNTPAPVSTSFGANQVPTGQNIAQNSQGGTGEKEPARAQNQPAVPNPLDWRILLGITVLLSVAFSLILLGHNGLRRSR